MEQRLAEKYMQVCRQRQAPDWAHAPLPFKLYRDGVRVPLSRSTLAALSTGQDGQPACSLGSLLHACYGALRMSYQYAPSPTYSLGDLPTPASFASPRLGRTVASGGARFPGELYLLVHMEGDLVPGLYHYDGLHHTLDLLRTGHFFPSLVQALARPPKRVPRYTILFSALFWKNAHKYQEFSYRLQGLDIGCLLAQTQIVSESYSLRPTFHWRFLDDQLNRLLGLNPLEESVYGVVTLEEDEAESVENSLSSPIAEISCSNALPRALETYQSLLQWPLLAAVHHASRIQTAEELHEQRTLPCVFSPAATTNLAISLPNVAPSALRAEVLGRRSAETWEYRASPLKREQLALLLRVVSRGYRADLDGAVPRLAHTLLYCIINQVEGIPPGIYLYLPQQQQLQQIAPGNYAQQFQQVQFDPLWDMAQVSLALIPVGSYALGLGTYGDRWYRMQNMEAGLCVQRSYLAAAQNSLLCRAQLSFDDRRLDRLLLLPDNYTSFIQILISPCETDKPAKKKKTHWIQW